MAVPGPQWYQQEVEALTAEKSHLFERLEATRKELKAKELQLSEERERCAKIADDLAQHHGFYDGGYEVGRKIAKAIRDGVIEKPKYDVPEVMMTFEEIEQKRATEKRKGEA